ncbi:uncharacterized protein CEXT_608281 [Caerostris extrusa]|uniref:Uncharacterized protein n=1 Tax=Caerostris extrusa TaxID=172846 RepID=A0AAV4TC15_CAEEX|nr:uncharacterized protein CEXT_608281 [Caerostris extrusa]
MVKFSATSSGVTRSAQQVKINYGRVNNGQLPSEIDYTKKENCLAYLHRYAVCHTTLVTEAVTDIFESSSANILTSKLDNKTLNVVFLGGGPGNDFVGFLTALYGRCDRVFDLDVTIVDRMSGWEDIFTETIEELRKGGERYGRTGLMFCDVNVIPNYIIADLKSTDEWTDGMKEKLKNADIVFFVKVLSHIPDNDKLPVLQNVISMTNLHVLIIYIDSPYPQKVFTSWKLFLIPVYESPKRIYYLKYKRTQFGICNIRKSSAEVRVFKR